AGVVAWAHKVAGKATTAASSKTAAHRGGMKRVTSGLSPRQGASDAKASPLICWHNGAFESRPQGRHLPARRGADTPEQRRKSGARQIRERSHARLNATLPITC